MKNWFKNNPRPRFIGLVYPGREEEYKQYTIKNYVWVENLLEQLGF
jgi:hypothetical protein